MDLALLALAALLIIVLISCIAPVNVGVLGLTAAWILGAYLAPAQGMNIGVKGVIAGFPVDLFLTLVGVSILFGLAKSNGTLDVVTERGARLCGERRSLILPLFFLLCGTLSASGAGNVAAVALLAPTALRVARRFGLSVLGMSLMIGHGGIAGGLSPLSAMGVVASDNLEKMGLAEHLPRILCINVLVNSCVAALGYWFVRRFDRTEPENCSQASVNSSSRVFALDSQLKPPNFATSESPEEFSWRHIVSLAVIGTWIIVSIGLRTHLGFSAIAASLVLVAFGAASERESLREVPWNVILMVTGVGTLVALVEKVGGLEVFSSAIASVASAQSAAGLLALSTGVISIFSSTSGVVLPTFLPLVDDLAARIPGADPFRLAMSVNIGSNLVDVSPVSTIGALCLAAAPSGVDRTKMFRVLFAWGILMAVVAGLICQFLP